MKWLEKTQITRRADGKGAWTYPGIGGDGDNSNTQFALLALHEAERAGVPASDQTWRLAKTYWEKCQNDDGSWGYNQPARHRHRQHDLRRHHLAGDRRRPGAAERRPGRRRPHRVLPAAATPTMPTASSGPCEWLGQTLLRRASNPGAAARWLLYYLYGLERAGRLTARRFIPLPPARPARPADWYREGAD